MHAGLHIGCEKSSALVEGLGAYRAAGAVEVHGEAVCDAGVRAAGVGD